MRGSVGVGPRRGLRAGLSGYCPAFGTNVSVRLDLIRFGVGAVVGCVGVLPGVGGGVLCWVLNRFLRVGSCCVVRTVRCLLLCL